MEIRLRVAESTKAKAMPRGLANLQLMLDCLGCLPDCLQIYVGGFFKWPKKKISLFCKVKKQKGTLLFDKCMCGLGAILNIVPVVSATFELDYI